MPKRIIEQVMKKVAGKGKRIVFSEGSDDRIIIAAQKIKNKNLGIPILLGKRYEIEKVMNSCTIKKGSLQIIEPEKESNLKQYANCLYTIRKNKGMKEEEALQLMKQPNYYGCMMVEKGDADGLVGGAVYTTAETLRPALQIIKTKPEIKLASSYFIMVLDDSVYFFADCSVNRYPSAEELSEIAISSADSAKQYGLTPRVAMLSYSTQGSGFGESVDLVKEATLLVKKKRKDILVDGEMQLDAAIVPDVAKRKCKNSLVAGKANVLVFPNLDSGNIGYKLVERLGHAKALGPIIQGLNKPVNDLSRGCTSDDAFFVGVITALLALEGGEKKPHFRSEKHLLGKVK